jgi:hypothetical protein
LYQSEGVSKALRAAGEDHSEGAGAARARQGRRARRAAKACMLEMVKEEKEAKSGRGAQKSLWKSNLRGCDRKKRRRTFEVDLPTRLEVMDGGGMRSRGRSESSENRTCFCCQCPS